VRIWPRAQYAVELYNHFPEQAGAYEAVLEVVDRRVSRRAERSEATAEGVMWWWACSCASRPSALARFSRAARGDESAALIAHRLPIGGAAAVAEKPRRIGLGGQKFRTLIGLFGLVLSYFIYAEPLRRLASGGATPCTRASRPRSAGFSNAPVGAALASSRRAADGGRPTASRRSKDTAPDHRRWIARSARTARVSRRRPWRTEASADAIYHLAYAIGDLNPLYVDPEYAARSRWGRLVAPHHGAEHGLPRRAQRLPEACPACTPSDRATYMERPALRAPSARGLKTSSSAKASSRRALAAQT
jgi:hypothetical protein